MKKVLLFSVVLVVLLQAGVLSNESHYLKDNPALGGNAALGSLLQESKLFFSYDKYSFDHTQKTEYWVPDNRPSSVRYSHRWIRTSQIQYKRDDNLYFSYTSKPIFGSVMNIDYRKICNIQDGGVIHTFINYDTPKEFYKEYEYYLSSVTEKASISISKALNDSFVVGARYTSIGDNYMFFYDSTATTINENTSENIEMNAKYYQISVSMIYKYRPWLFFTADSTQTEDAVFDYVGSSDIVNFAKKPRYSIGTVWKPLLKDYQNDDLALAFSLSGWLFENEHPPEQFAETSVHTGFSYTYKRFSLTFFNAIFAKSIHDRTSLPDLTPEIFDGYYTRDQQNLILGYKFNNINVSLFHKREYTFYWNANRVATSRTGLSTSILF